MDFNVYIFPSHTLVTLRSLTNFAGQKMQGGRQERSFSSKYFTPKCNYSKESIFYVSQ